MSERHPERMMWRPSAYDEKPCEYVRADLLAAVEAKLVEAESDRGRILLAWAVYENTIEAIRLIGLRPAGTPFPSPENLPDIKVAKEALRVAIEGK